MKIVCWNINGIRACLKHGLLGYIQNESADIYLFQETKIQTKDMEQLMLQLSMMVPEYKPYYACSEIKKGYSGVLTLAKAPVKANLAYIGYRPIDVEGRIMVTELDKCVLINVYAPNSGAMLERIDYKKTFNKKLQELMHEQEKPVILAGDLNVIHQENDAWNFKNKDKRNGFMQVERDWLDDLLANDYIDVFRELHPNKSEYSWYLAGMVPRIIEKGWRLDYFIAHKSLKNKITSSTINPHTYGSDHVPICLQLDI